MNLGPILTIETPFRRIYIFYYFQHHFILKIQKHIYVLAYTTKTQEHHYHIIFLHCYLLCCICYHILFYLHLHFVVDKGIANRVHYLCTPEVR
jgi:hypothetical protein